MRDRNHILAFQIVASISFTILTFLLIPIPWYLHLLVGGCFGAMFDMHWSRRMRRKHGVPPEVVVGTYWALIGSTRAAPTGASLFFGHVAGWAILWPGLVLVEFLKVPFPLLRGPLD